ncbi:MAG: sulfatase-like hydrolase/transferase [Planctomycetota bacterium]
MGKQHPNIIVLMADTVQSQALSCYGSPNVRTPHIDALAGQACLFERLYQPANMCKPSRTSWMTGCYPSTHQVYDNTSFNDRKQTTLLKLLSQAGYRGGYLGLFHCWHDRDRDGMDAWSWIDWAPDYGIEDPSNPTPPTRQDFLRHLAAMGVYPTGDHLKDFHDHAGYTDFPIEHHLCTRITDKAIACIDDFRSDQANFLWYSSWMPHEPWAPPAPYHTRYRPADMILPGNLRDPLTSRPAHQRVNHGRCAQVFSPDATGDGQLSRILAAYAGMVSFVDDNVGRIIAHLKRRGLYDDSIVVFTTDHGTAHGAHGWLYKGGPYMIDEISRIPLLIKFPGQSQPQRIPDVLSSTDLFPTLLEHVGVAHAPVDGRSLSDVIAGKRRNNARAFGEHLDGTDHEAKSVRMLRKGRWKYNLYSQAGVDELYDLDADPLELHNIAADAGSIRRELRDELVDYIRSRRDTFVVR